MRHMPVITLTFDPPSRLCKVLHSISGINFYAVSNGDGEWYLKYKSNGGDVYEVANLFFTVDTIDGSGVVRRWCAEDEEWTYTIHRTWEGMTYRLINLVGEEMERDD